jgi:hypothetical protein
MNIEMTSNWSDDVSSNGGKVGYGDDHVVNKKSSGTALECESDDAMAVDCGNDDVGSVVGEENANCDSDGGTF